MTDIEICQRVTLYCQWRQYLGVGPATRKACEPGQFKD